MKIKVKSIINNLDTYKLKPNIILIPSFIFLNNVQLTYLDFQDILLDLG